MRDMDYEEKKKRQLIRVAIAEIGMVFAVVAIVIVATLATMGFFISNGQIEQSGLMQIHSIPTGATVKLDGNVLFSRTNLSRMMNAGDHQIVISRDGYDTWENVVKMYSGVLIRLYYPRLFLQNRIATEVMSLRSGNASVTDLGLYSGSPSRNYILYAQSKSTEWRLVDLRGNEVKETTLDLASVLPWVTKSGDDMQAKKDNSDTAVAAIGEYKFDGQVEIVSWSENDEKVLVKAKASDGQMEWILVDLRNIASSLNLSKTFGLTFTQVDMIDNAANQLFVLENHNLRKIDIASKTISGVLLRDVEEFSSYESNVMYVTIGIQDGETGQEQRWIGVYRNGEENGTIIEKVAAEAQVFVVLAKYFSDYYMCYIVDNKPIVLYGALPAYNSERADLSGLEKLEVASNLSDSPEKVSLSRNNEYLVTQAGELFMVVDLDDGSVFEYDALAREINWLDDSMLYNVRDGHMIVWDFDGANKRDLTESAKGENGERVMTMAQDVIITANDRWLYYLSEKDDKIVLMREKIVE